MPPAPRRLCLAYPCSAAAAANGRCPKHQPAIIRGADSREWHKLYGRRWQRYRLVFLGEHPLCADPFRVHGRRFVAATVVDHIDPHRGDYDRFWNPINHQALCATCHSRKTAAEDGGFGNRSRP